MEWDEVRGTIMMMIAPDLLLESGKSLTNPEFTGQERYGTYDPFLQHLGVLLLEARDAGIPITQLHAESTALILLRHLNRRAESLAARKSPQWGRLQQVIEYIRTNLGTELSIVDLARIAQTSPFTSPANSKRARDLHPTNMSWRGGSKGPSSFSPILVSRLPTWHRLAALRRRLT
jgi:hypothetical protein